MRCRQIQRKRGAPCRSTIMATCNDSPEVATAYGDTLPGASKPWFSRLTFPLLYAAIGLSLGTATGTAAATVTTPVGAQTKFNDSRQDSIQASATGFELAVSPRASTVLKANFQPATVVYVAANTGKPATDSGHSTANQVPTGASPGIPAVTVDPSPAIQTAPDKTPAEEKNPTHPSAPAEKHLTKPFAYPLAHSARKELASVPEGAPAAMGGKRLNLGDDAKPSGSLVEGDLTVADYNAKAGTIEICDGRTFAVGSTVSISGAPSWNEYRSDLHHRCGQDGSCTLTRAAVAALNTKLV